MDWGNQRSYLMICALLSMLLSSCSLVNEDYSSQVNSESIQRNETENVETEKVYLPGRDYELAHFSEVTKFAEVGETVRVDESYEVRNPYEITICRAEVTDTFEEDLSKWEDYMLEDIDIKDKKIVGEEKIVYIDYTVKNCEDEKLEFYTSSVSLVYIEDDYIYSAEIAFSSENKGGKSAYQVVLDPGESKDIKIGYIIPENNLNNEMYINLTGPVNLGDDCCLVKLQ